MEQGTVRVMIVDDHAVVRSGLSAFLMAYDDLEFVGEASGGLEAVRKCSGFRPDVVLMDLVMPEVDGSEATRLIREACPHVQVIALTSYKEEELVQGALKAGAIGYLLKNVSADELANAIRAGAGARGRGGAHKSGHPSRRSRPGSDRARVRDTAVDGRRPEQS
jgi:NarL family two-component system response regulator LiaR